MPPLAPLGFFLRSIYTQVSRAHALLLPAYAGREPSLMACKKQMSASQPLVFSCAHYILPILKKFVN